MDFPCDRPISLPGASLEKPRREGKGEEDEERGKKRANKKRSSWRSLADLHRTRASYQHTPSLARILSPPPRYRKKPFERPKALISFPFAIGVSQSAYQGAYVGSSRCIPQLQIGAETTAFSTSIRRIIAPRGSLKQKSYRISRASRRAGYSESLAFQRPQARRPGFWIDSSLRIRPPATCLSCYRPHHEPRPPRLPPFNPYPDRTQCRPTMARGPPASPSGTPCPRCTCPCQRTNQIS